MVREHAVAHVARPEQTLLHERGDPGRDQRAHGVVALVRGRGEHRLLPQAARSGDARLDDARQLRPAARGELARDLDGVGVVHPGPPRRLGELGLVAQRPVLRRVGPRHGDAPEVGRTLGQQPHDVLVQRQHRVDAPLAAGARDELHEGVRRVRRGRVPQRAHAVRRAPAGGAGRVGAQHPVPLALQGAAGPGPGSVADPEDEDACGRGPRGGSQRRGVRRAFGHKGDAIDRGAVPRGSGDEFRRVTRSGAHRHETPIGRTGATANRRGGPPRTHSGGDGRPAEDAAEPAPCPPRSPPG